MQSIYRNIAEARHTNRKKFAVLIDPDKVKAAHIEEIIGLAGIAGVDFFFIGGSLVVNSVMDFCIETIKRHSDIPAVLFPGGTIQLTDKADAILFLSLISGRNADLLIGKQVEAAPFLVRSKLEVISTGYMLVDGGVPTAASYMSNTFPIPAHKNEIAVCTALAGELLGLKVIYMDAGSGAKFPISESMIRDVKSHVNIPLIVGGGIRTPERAQAAAYAGADVVVVGNAIERDPSLLIEMAAAVHSVHQPAKLTTQNHLPL